MRKKKTNKQNILFLFQSESNGVPEMKNGTEPMDKEEAVRAYNGLCESKK